MSFTAPIFGNSLYTGSGTAGSSSAGSTSSTGSLSSSSGSRTLGEADFMTLLIAQLKNQDPLNPTDNTQFVSQLATFSSLQQQTTMTQNLQQSTAVGLLGTYVTDNSGHSGQVAAVNNSATNGLQLTINTTQTNSNGTKSIVPVQIKYSDISQITLSSGTSTGTNNSTNSSTNS
ncbi:MAG: flagellar hook capping protein [Nitrospirae bacterium]|nr:flagellar hook capping protein [Nitrospirota bacterium]